MADEKEGKNAGGKKPGWHSRRYQTNVANRQATERYQAAHGPKARQRAADEREEATRVIAVHVQLARLDARLGTDMGAEKERKRLIREL